METQNCTIPSGFGAKTIRLHQGLWNSAVTPNLYISWTSWTNRGFTPSGIWYDFQMGLAPALCGCGKSPVRFVPEWEEHLRIRSQELVYLSSLPIRQLLPKWHLLYPSFGPLRDLRPQILFSSSRWMKDLLYPSPARVLMINDTW